MALSEANGLTFYRLSVRICICTYCSVPKPNATVTPIVFINFKSVFLCNVKRDLSSTLDVFTFVIAIYFLDNTCLQ